MDLAISNLAWSDNSPETFDIIKSVGINNIEGVFTKIKDWPELDGGTIIEYKNWLKQNDIKLYSVQSLFYNIPCNDITDIKTIKNHFTRVCAYGAFLGAKVLVFGSPNLRKKTEGWKEALVDIFTYLDKIISNVDMKIVIEPNASVYGGEFFTNLSEIVDFIEVNNFKNIKTMIDTHNLILEGFDPSIEFIKHFKYIWHIHISEEKLKPLVINEQHLRFSGLIKKSWYDKGITYEVSNVDDLKTTLLDFVNTYK